MEWMSRRHIDRVRAVSKAKNGPWLKWYDEMAKKSAIHRLAKRLEKSREIRRLQTALESDDSLTIDGVAEPEAEQLPAPAPAKPTKRAAPAPKPPADPPGPKAPPAPEPQPMQAEAGVFADDPPADEPAADEPTQGWMPIDEIGEPIDPDVRILDPLSFAEWFAGRMKPPPTPRR